MKKYIYILSIASGLFAFASCQESVENDPGFEIFDKTKPEITGVVTGTKIVDDRAVYLTVSESSYKEEETAKAKEVGVCWSTTDSDPKVYALTGGEKPTGYTKNFTSTKETSKIGSLFVGGLSPETKIYYRTFVMNAAGISYGEVKEYTTKNYTVESAKLKSEDSKGNVVFDKTFDLAPLVSITQFHALKMYGDNDYIIEMDYDKKTGAVTVDKQKAYVDASLSEVSTDNIVSIEGTGSYDEATKTIELELEHTYTVKKGVTVKFPIYKETITW